MGRIRWFSAGRGYGFIEPLDGTGELLVYGNDFEEPSGEPPDCGALVQYREHFHQTIRMVKAVRPAPGNVIALHPLAERCSGGWVSKPGGRARPQ